MPHFLPISKIYFQPFKIRIRTKDYGSNQCCGAENISFGSGSTELQIRISAPAQTVLKYTLKNTFFD